MKKPIKILKNKKYIKIFLPKNLKQKFEVFSKIMCENEKLSFPEKSFHMVEPVAYNIFYRGFELILFQNNL